jgi:hypothetical protein
MMEAGMSSKHRPDPQKSLVGFVVGDVHYAVPIAALDVVAASSGGGRRGR